LNISSFAVAIGFVVTSAVTLSDGLQAVKVKSNRTDEKKNKIIFIIFLPLIS
jgi:hypothetical protein